MIVEACLQHHDVLLPHPGVEGHLCQEEERGVDAEEGQERGEQDYLDLK